MNDTLRENVSKTALTNINAWLTEPKYAEYRSQLESLIAAEEWEILEDSFFKVIEFGTGGIRGTTGVGSNRISRVTIGEATQALSEYVLHQDAEAKKKGIVIACDTRLSSEELSRYAAQVCAGNGMKAYLFESFRSTPELSFAVRYLGASAGIVISASHNPPADNGFKAYLADGGQLVPPHDKGVIERTKRVTSIHSLPYDVAVTKNLIQVVGTEIDEAYISAVQSEALGDARDVSIVYSPLHGAGQRNTLPVLVSAGFTKVATVKSQMTPDGTFPTIENGKPNPEEKAANDRAVAQMLADDADIAITNDPDADRIGVVVREGDQPMYLSGNQTAVLATEFALRKLYEKGQLTSKHYIAKTIVTTDMMKAVADKYQVTTYGDMLIGFKYIGELLLQKESTDEIFVIGGEESYGLLKGDYARDKDGAVGALILSEYAAELKNENKTLFDRMIELYREYGLFVERLDTIVCPGAKGFEQMQNIMARLRTDAPRFVAHHQVTAISDYSVGIKTMLDNGEKTSLSCPVKGDVIVLEFGDARRRITVRPSGTEPKLKLYVQWFDEAQGDALSLRRQYADTNDMLESLSRELEGILLRG
ncbi:MAG: phospho-sugar mutase [Candidatus Saccharimonadales bacterium]